MTTMLAVLAGLGAFIGVNAVLAFVYGLAAGASQLMYVLLRLSPLSLPIRMLGWAVAGYIGFAAYEAVTGY